MSESRAVRIPRSRTAPAPTPVDVEEPAVPERAPTIDRRPNRAGMQRAQRLSIAYVAVLFLVYAGFVAYDRSTPSGASPGAASSLLLFGEVALALALGGVILTLLSAPRAIELSPYQTMVLGSLGTRRQFPPISSIQIRVLRRYPAGFLSTVPTVSTELSAGTLRRTYLLEEGLLPPSPPAGAPG